VQAVSDDACSLQARCSDPDAVSGLRRASLAERHRLASVSRPCRRAGRGRTGPAVAAAEQQRQRRGRRERQREVERERAAAQVEARALGAVQRTVAAAADVVAQEVQQRHLQGIG